jgi:hypothetical protein
MNSPSDVIAASLAASFFEALRSTVGLAAIGAVSVLLTVASAVSAFFGFVLVVFVALDGTVAFLVTLDGAGTSSSVSSVGAHLGIWYMSIKQLPQRRIISYLFLALGLTVDDGLL